VSRANKSGRAAPGSKHDPSVVMIYAEDEADRPAALSRALTHPTVQASQTLYALNRVNGDDYLTVEALRAELATQIKGVNGGDLKRAEALLTAQAHTLDALFNYYVRSAMASELLSQFEVKLRLALRAQNQCRATLETLALIKNPQPVAFVRQANIAHGPQQVNNATAVPQESSRAGDSEKGRNEVLEKCDERLDDRMAQATRGADLAMATEGSVNRPTDSQR